MWWFWVHSGCCFFATQTQLLQLRQRRGFIVNFCAGLLLRRNSKGDSFNPDLGQLDEPRMASYFLSVS